MRPKPDAVPVYHQRLYQEKDGAWRPFCASPQLSYVAATCYEFDVFCEQLTAPPLVTIAGEKAFKLEKTIEKINPLN